MPIIRPNRSGFTLAELLIVIAIVMMMLAALICGVIHYFVP